MKARPITQSAMTVPMMMLISILFGFFGWFVSLGNARWIFAKLFKSDCKSVANDLAFPSANVGSKGFNADRHVVWNFGPDVNHVARVIRVSPDWQEFFFVSGF
jgi:hypothetical protein